MGRLDDIIRRNEQTRSHTRRPLPPQQRKAVAAVLGLALVALFAWLMLRDPDEYDADEIAAIEAKEATDELCAAARDTMSRIDGPYASLAAPAPEADAAYCKELVDATAAASKGGRSEYVVFKQIVERLDQLARRCETVGAKRTHEALTEHLADSRKRVLSSCENR